ncbi:MAG: helix-turn-helix domain-containing protein [Eubacterium sp.]|nr:helix-turn-helix domain-containing protein [Eubacterium sp.]
MDTAKTIKELREGTGMSRKEFSEHTGIPVRTLEDWEAGRRTPPEYLPRLIAYQLKFEGFFAQKEKSTDKISIITDPDGKKIVLINDILFKSRRSIDWDEIEKILKKYIGEYYEIAETAEKVYIGSDFPDEFTHSKYTKAIKGANEKAKANAITAIGELIQIADNKADSPDYDRRHGNKAKNGWYRYDTRFGIPVYNELGEIDRYNIFRARMLVRCDDKNKLYLYDIVQIKKETSTPLE